ncbi:hypothetical protein HF086_015285 [Spodoptera exigua]|uniref:Vacuolar protein sorting-associated protein 18 homolog n=1 Tax=Spodoptera exigua TaxID=7107 RepID=A0A922M8P6_SPOEX|nr:hypothetical protein HF086_015285 [Spodoptera exigua]
MTSIFDQYEQASQSSQRPKPVTEPMVSSGYINMLMEDNTPMFSKSKMILKNLSDAITHAAVCNDYLVLAMANGNLFRLNLKKPDCGEEIQYSKFVQPNSKLTGIFLDPLGHHLLMAFISKKKDGYPELIYLHQSSSKYKLVSKSRNYEVTEVGWNWENTSEVNTGPILLGTSQGHIIETELEVDSDKTFTASHPYWREIFDIGKGTDMPITGIQFHRVNNTSRYFIFITTPTRLYQFMGQAVMKDNKPSLQSIFYSYLTIPETGFQEIPSTLKYSKLQFFDKNDVPKTFAWLTEPGIFYGQLDPTSQQNSNSLFTQGALISYPTDGDEPENAPLSFVLTEFHVLLMYSDRVKVISLISQELVFEDKYSEAQGKLKNIVRDAKKRTIWAITDKCVFRYKVVREERNLWIIYSDKEQFDLAKEYCYNNPAYIDVINVKQAELLFNKGEYEKSAAIFAETQKSFETICLKFLEIDQINALKVYLEKRLESLKEDEKTLISMLVIWMTELYLSQLGLLRRTGKQDTEEYHQIQSNFEVFLLHPKVAKCMQHVKSVVYDLMASHGDKLNLIKLTIINEDYESVVAQYINKKSYLEAIDTLKTLKRPELFYQFAATLMEEIPKHTVNALISQGARLSPSKLLPAFLSCKNDEAHVSEIIRYLEFILQHFNVRDKAIHNYLLTLYVEHDHEALMMYLARQGQDVTMVNYDVHYALRLCREKNLSEACVKLSALLGLWDSAVELALQENNNQIEEMKAEMEEAIAAAEYVRAEIQSFRNRSVTVLVSDVCCLCDIALLLRPFYLFPCGHRFHSDCLMQEALPILTPARRNKLSDLQRQLSVLSNIELSTITSSGLPLREILRNEIDDLIASECIFCGEYMINCIDKPFISDEDWDKVMKEWE